MTADPIALCLAGAISRPVMLARLVMAGWPDGAIEQQLAARDKALLGFFHAHAGDLPRLRRMAAQMDHARCLSPMAIAARYDAASAIAAEASVAAYSLGDPALLRAATAEVVDWLRRTGLFRAGMQVLDLGCGFGRIAAALAPAADFVLGLDVSSRMIAEGCRRYGGLPHLRLALTSGNGLDELPTAAFDLALAVDSFPYLLQSGAELAHRHVSGLGRALRSGGTLAVLNLSYRDDPAADADQVIRWAASAGLTLERRDPVPFRLWDAPAFVFRRAHRFVRGEAPGLPPGTDAAWQRLEESR